MMIEVLRWPFDFTRFMSRNKAINFFFTFISVTYLLKKLEVKLEVKVFHAQPTWPYILVFGLKLKGNITCRLTKTLAEVK